MIDPAELLDALVDALRAIPELRSEMNGDEARIAAYHYRFPDENSLVKAVHEMPAPGILVAWRGAGPGQRGGFQCYEHQLSLFLRSREQQSGDDATGYYRLYRYIADGVPGGSGLPLIHRTVHASCDPMSNVPGIVQQTDAEGVDYFEVGIAFKEIVG